MKTSPLARVIAPRTAAPVIETNAVKNAVTIPVARPDFGKFIDKFCEDNGLYFNYYATVERIDKKLVFGKDKDVLAQITSHTAKITDALSAEFPEWEVTPTIQGETYIPPFSVSWDFNRKGA